MNIKVVTVVATSLLGACSGQATYPVMVDPDATIAVSAAQLSFAGADGKVMTLERSADYDYGAFVGALQNGGDQPGMISIFQSDDATAAIAVQIVDGASVAFTSYERLTVSDARSAGTATYSGSLISAFVDPDAELGVTQLRSDMTLLVNFDRQTIEGEVRGGTAYLLGFPVEFELDADAFDIDLLETGIAYDGTFAGEAVFASADREHGTYAGLIAGEAGAEVVGDVVLSDRVGVFAAGAD